MAVFDLSIDQLHTHRSASAEPEDFASFWERTLEEARSHPLDVSFTPVAGPLRAVEVHDVSFAGFGGHPVRGWLTLPAVAEEPLPLVVEFAGYGGGRGLPHTQLLHACAGYAHFVMDTRGQGAGWGGGDTPDPAGSGPSLPGFMTRGIDDPDLYYYRRVYTDAVRAVEAARSHPLTDAASTVVIGTSQGGGIALAAGGLVPDLAGVAPHVPFLCDFPRAITLTDRRPYREIGDYLKTFRDRGAAARRTLSYFDGVHFAARGRAPALFAAALEDRTCPPSTVFAAFNAYAGEDKRIEVYEFNDHEGGGPHHEAVQLDWLAGLPGFGTRA
ncbi:acetylxylan esterase [Streptomyces sp. NBC_01187]|uniref:acetylxylan esterase n=1 Tax=Streptomyces sp. NBC_01187 TaxID=2903766 RepID=UPI003868C3EB|nr:acetylxylan esterase [Streptomyces sp. NBC_01187]